MARLRLTEYRQLTDLELLGHEWAALWQTAPDATVFQSPPWQIAWWRHFGGTGLAAFAFRDGDDLVGLAPMFVWDAPEGRKLVPVGSGISDYCGLLAAPGYTDPVADALMAAIAASADRWDVCEWQELRTGSPLLAAAVPAGLADRVCRRDTCPTLDFAPGAASLDDVLPSGRTEKVRYYRRRAAKLGEVAVEAADGDNLDRLLDVLFALHGATWQARGEAGMLADPVLQAFHREAARGLLDLGALLLFTINLNGRPVAAYYGFVSGGLGCVYLTGNDPAWRQPAFGTLAVAQGIEIALARGARRFSFLRGREPHKYAWGAIDEPTWTRTLRR